MDKFKLEKEQVPDFLKEIGFKYIEGLVWILEYYYQGVPSWSWLVPQSAFKDLSNAVQHGCRAAPAHSRTFAE